MYHRFAERRTPHLGPLAGQKRVEYDKWFVNLPEELLPVLIMASCACCKGTANSKAVSGSHFVSHVKFAAERLCCEGRRMIAITIMMVRILPVLELC